MDLTRIQTLRLSPSASHSARTAPARNTLDIHRADDPSAGFVGILSLEVPIRALVTRLEAIRSSGGGQDGTQAAILRRKVLAATRVGGPRFGFEPLRSEPTTGPGSPPRISYGLGWAQWDSVLRWSYWIADDVDSGADTLKCSTDTSGCFRASCSEEIGKHLFRAYHTA